MNLKQWQLCLVLENFVYISWVDLLKYLSIVRLSVVTEDRTMMARTTKLQF